MPDTRPNIILFITDQQRGEQDSVRDVLHGEHAGCYAYEHGNHFLVDGRTKYIRYSQTGREQLFDLQNDPDELHDLVCEADADDRLKPWRRRLADVLAGRPEGFADGDKLISGQPHKPFIPGYERDRIYRFL